MIQNLQKNPHHQQSLFVSIVITLTAQPSNIFAKIRSYVSVMLHTNVRTLRRKKAIKNNVLVRGNNSA